MIVDKLGWRHFGGITVPYFPGFLSVVVPTARGTVELVCTFRGEVALFSVEAPAGFTLDARTHGQWLSLQREDLLTQMEAEMGAELRWRILRHQDGTRPLVCVRAPTIEEGLDYVGKVVAEYASDLRRQPGET